MGGGVAVPVRPTRFFWAFAGEVPEEAGAEDLAALGRQLTG